MLDLLDVSPILRPSKQGKIQGTVCSAGKIGLEGMFNRTMKRSSVKKGKLITRNSKWALHYKTNSLFLTLGQKNLKKGRFILQL
jgi:hypothetical protein